jgi:hypothetical protein
MMMMMMMKMMKMKMMMRFSPKTSHLLRGGYRCSSTSSKTLLVEKSALFFSAFSQKRERRKSSHRGIRARRHPLSALSLSLLNE